MMPLHLQTRRRENLGKTLAEIAVGEVDATQAARS
jgi:hypothetical protein